MRKLVAIMFTVIMAYMALSRHGEEMAICLLIQTKQRNS